MMGGPNRVRQETEVVQVNIWGNASHVTKQEQRYATSFFLNELVGTRLASNIVISISNLKRKEHEHALLYGEVLWKKNNHLPRDFSVHVNPVLTRATSLKTLAHELVHVKQFARGEMKDLGYKSKLSRRWKDNRRYDPSDRNGYWTFPWEIEARAKEVVLFDLYSNHLDRMNLSFS
jgi:hypothetical protein